MLASLKADGRMGVILPHGVLFRSGEEGKIREGLLFGTDAATGNQPGDLTAYLFRAEARLQQNRFDDALADIDQARAIDNENIDALLLRGQIREAKRLAME